MPEQVKIAEFMSEQGCYEPFGILSRLRTSEPIAWIEPLHAWFITPYEAVSDLYRDKRIQPGGVHMMIDAMPQEQREALQPLRDLVVKMLLSLPEERHHELIGILRAFFGPKSMTRLREDIRLLSQGLMDDLEDAVKNNETIDWYQQFAYLLPARVITRLMGVAPEDDTLFVAWSEQFLTIFFASSSFEDFLAGQRAFLAMRDYCEDLLNKRLEQPADDLMSVLANALREGKVEREEILANCPFILFAGHETTAGLLSVGLQLLCEHPEQLQLLREDPTLLPNAVQEMLRFHGPSSWTSRVVMEDLSYGGHEFKAGEMLYLSNTGANHDADVYDRPEVFDIRRAFRAKPHMGFGLGPHYCLGVHLAKAEAEIAFSMLLERYSKIECDSAHIGLQPLPPVARVYKRMPVRLG